MTKLYTIRLVRKAKKYRCNGESVPVEEGREETEAHCRASTGQEEQGAEMEKRLAEPKELKERHPIDTLYGPKGFTGINDQ